MTAEGFIDDDALERSLAALREHGSAGQPQEMITEVLLATRRLFAASGAGLMLIDESTALRSVAATDAAAQMLERKQEQLGHGPCVDAVVLDKLTESVDLLADQRWTELGAALAGHGVRAVLGVPVRLDGVAVGALNVFRDKPHSWSPSEISALSSYGGLIQGVLRAALQTQQRTKLAEQLQHALDNRVIIERAVGVLMGRERIDPVEAFNGLRKRARNSGRRVSDLAQELLDAVSEAD